MSNQVARANGVYSLGGNISAGEIVIIHHDNNRTFLTITNDGVEDLKVYFGYDTHQIATENSKGNYMLLKGINAGNQTGENILNVYPVPICQIHLIPEKLSVDFKASVITDSKVELKQYTP